MFPRQASQLGVNESSGRDDPSRRHTFVFADLAGYTALTDAHGDRHAAEVAREFYAVIESLTDGRSAQIVKTLGDGVLIRFDRADEAVVTAIDIVRLSCEAPGGLAVRVGAHRGTAVQIEQDWFGATVNLASRIADAAEKFQVVISDDVRIALPEALVENWSFMGERRLKHVARPVRLYSRQMSRSAGKMPIDPVCHMSVDPARSPARRTYMGHTYFFCSDKCSRRFKSDPDVFAQAFNSIEGDYGGQ